MHDGRGGEYESTFHKWDLAAIEHASVRYRSLFYDVPVFRNEV